MKKLVLISACFLLINNLVHSQEKKDTSLNKLAVSVCNCISKNGVEKIKTKDEAEQIFLKCILDSANEKVLEFIGSEDTDKKGKEFGEKLAIEMVKNGCTSFLTLSLRLADGDKDDSPVASVRETKSIEGKVIEVNEGDFLTIKLKATNGREYEFIYTSYIEGSDTWLKEPQTKLKGKNIKVQWKETEMYQPKKKDFVNLKELVAVVINK